MKLYSKFIGDPLLKCTDSPPKKSRKLLWKQAVWPHKGKGRIRLPSIIFQGRFVGNFRGSFGPCYLSLVLEIFWAIAMSKWTCVTPEDDQSFPTFCDWVCGMIQRFPLKKTPSRDMDALFGLEKSYKPARIVVNSWQTCRHGFEGPMVIWVIG